MSMNFGKLNPNGGWRRLNAEPLLRNFMPGEHADSIERFRSVDDQMSELASRYIRARICGAIPDKSEVMKSGGLGLPRHRLELKRPGKPIRP
jgi:hypothetical protein